MTIERFKGVAPKCRYCGKALKPNYKTEKEQYHSVTGKRKVWADPNCETWENMKGSEVKGVIPSDPTKPDTYTDRTTTWHWSVRKQAWYRWEESQKILSRKFLGTFGAERDSLFCGKYCGWAWAVAKLKTIPQ